VKQPEAARQAVAIYSANVGGEATEPLDTQVTDLIADLLHLLADSGCYSEDEAIGALESGRFHFEYEETRGYEGEA
jgi:hypothetical protein